MRVNLPTGRIQSIDAFRGITIFTMIFVNELAGVRGIPWWMKHAGADDDAMTFVDVVFPAFLFIVGMAIPFAGAQRRRSASGDIKYVGHTLWRAASLLIMGVFMVNAEGDYSEKEMGMPIHVWTLLFYLGLILVWTKIKGLSKGWVNVMRTVGLALLVVLAFVYKDSGGGPISARWWGILGLIGWAYLMTSIIYAITGGRRTWLFICILISFAYYVFGHYAFPGNIFFQHVLLSQGGHAVHSGTVLSGVLLSLIFFRVDLLLTDRQRFIGAIWFCASMLIVGAFVRPFTPISKIYATPSWAAFSIAACIGIFCLIFLLVERLKWNSWTKWVAPAAVNPLLVYIIPFVVYAFMQLAGLSFPSSFYNGSIGIVWAAVYSGLVMAIGSVLTRVGLIIRI